MPLYLVQPSTTEEDKFYAEKPQPRRVRYVRNYEAEELEAKKRRWRIRRALFGNTGSGPSCNFMPSRVLLLYCKEHRVRVKDVVDHLVEEKIV